MHAKFLCTRKPYLRSVLPSATKRFLHQRWHDKARQKQQFQRRLDIFYSIRDTSFVTTTCQYSVSTTHLINYYINFYVKYIFITSSCFVFTEPQNMWEIYQSLSKNKIDVVVNNGFCCCMNIFLIWQSTWSIAAVISRK